MGVLECLFFISLILHFNKKPRQVKTVALAEPLAASTKPMHHCSRVRGLNPDPC